MTRNLQRIGGKALVALMATMMLLSVFAGPAAASGIDAEDTAVFEATADQIDGDLEFSDAGDGDAQTFTITTDTGTVNEGDEIAINLDEGAINNDDDFVFLDAEAVVSGTQTDINDVSAEIRQDGPFVGTAGDQIMVTVDDVNDGSTEPAAGEDNIDVTVDLRIGDDVKNEVDGAYSGANVGDELSIAQIDLDDSDIQDDGASSFGSTIDEETAIELAVEPGAPHDITLDVSDQNFNDGDSTETAEIVDEFDNVATDTELEETAYSGDVTFTLSGEELADRTETVTASDGTAEVTLTDSNGGESIERFVGSDVTLEAQADDPGDDFAGSDNATDTFDISPDQVDVEFADASYFAHDGETTVEVSLHSDSPENLIDDSNIDVVDIEFSESQGDSVTLTADDEAEEVPAFSELISEDAQTHADVETNTVVYTFESTQATTASNLGSAYEIDPTVVNTQASDDGNADTVDVDPAAPSTLEAALAEDDHDVTAFEGDTAQVDVTIEDDFDNVVDRDGYYGESDIEVALEGVNEDTSTVYTVTSGTDAATTIDIDATANDGNTDEIGEPFVGDNLTVSAEQLNYQNPDNALDDSDASLEIDITPNAVVLTEATSDQVNAGEENNLDLTLEKDSSDALESGEIDELTVSFAFATEDVPIEGDEATLTNEDNFDEVDGEPLTEVELTVTEQVDAETFAFNSTAAGAFEVEAEALDVTGSTSEFDVVPLEPVSANVEVTEDFAGIVADEGGDIEVEIELRDTFENDAAYGGDGDNFDQLAGDNFDVILADQQFTIDNGFNGLSADVTNLIGSAIVIDDLTPADIDESQFETGDTDVVVDVDDDDIIGQGEITLVHEVEETEGQFEFTSMPQTATLELNDSVVDVSQYNASANNYEFVEEDASGFTLDSENVGVDTLHKGIVVESDGDARIGFDFVADDSAPQEVTLEEDGYHLLGSNFDISADDGEREIKEELAFRSVNAMDDTNLDEINEIVPRDTEGQATIQNETNINAFQGYWVRLSDTDADENSPGVPEIRTVLDPAYDPEDRSSQ